MLLRNEQDFVTSNEFCNPQTNVDLPQSNVPIRRSKRLRHGEDLSITEERCFVVKQ